MKMGLSEDGEDAVERRFEELCLDLNMDKHAREESWTNYQMIRENYSLEVSFCLPPRINTKIG